MKFEETKNKVSRALPHMDKFIQQYPDSAIFYMYDQLRDDLFSALAKQLGAQTELEDFERVRRTIDMTQQVIDAASIPLEIASPPFPGIMRSDEERPSIP